MVQDQLVEYVSSQIKLGISRDAIKSALVGVGWAPLDVEDTLKKVEGSAVSAPVQPIAPLRTMDTGMSATVSPKLVSFSTPGIAAGPTMNPAPQSIKVSDLVSAIAPASGMPGGTAPKTIPSGGPAIGKVSMNMSSKDPFPKGTAQGNITAFSSPIGKKKMKFGLVEIILVVLIVAIGAFAGYLFMKTNTLTSELSAAQAGAGQQNQVAVQASATQLQALNASNTALTAEVASLTAENQNISTNLLFLAAPAGLSSSTAVAEASLSGTLSAGLKKNTYIITTQYGVKVNVQNSSDTAVTAALTPLLGTSIQVSGTYVPGIPNILVMSVNGATVSSPSAGMTTPTSSVSSTKPMTP
jgi:Tfp pilus assembly protein PilE